MQTGILAMLAVGLACGTARAEGVVYFDNHSGRRWRTRTRNGQLNRFIGMFDAPVMQGATGEHIAGTTA